MQPCPKHDTGGGPCYCAPNDSNASQQELLCCPFCGGTDLVNSSWYVKDAEVDAIECNTCFAGALKRTWNQRHAENYKD